jgi:hypothetical protein
VWGNRATGRLAEEQASKILTGDDLGWKLIQIDGDKQKGIAPWPFQVILMSAIFRYILFKFL